MVERGYVSSYAGDKARVAVPERDGAVTQPLTVGGGAMIYTMTDNALLAEKPAIGAAVAFVEYSDGDGVIIAQLQVI